jgi:acyl phosphate:glycerol-3-phosphate acyltransferase
MDDGLNGVLAVVGAYMLGSLSFAVIVSRVLGLTDPRTYGSGNPGATNVLRSGNKTAAVLTLLLDAVKGWIPVALVVSGGASLGLSAWWAGPVGLAAFLGHLYPVFFRFQGGKGVATALGVLLGISGWLGLATAVSWLVIALFFRYSSLAAMVAAVFAPFYYTVVGGWLWTVDVRVAIAIAAMSALLIVRHRENIGRLLSGTESRLGKKKTSDPTTGDSKAPD